MSLCVKFEGKTYKNQAASEKRIWMNVCKLTYRSKDMTWLWYKLCISSFFHSLTLSLRAQFEIPVLLQILVSPVLAGLAVGIGVPILLFYVYGVVPVSLCRSGAGVSFVYDDDENDLLGVLGARNTGKIHDGQKYIQTDHLSWRLY